MSGPYDQYSTNSQGPHHQYPAYDQPSYYPSEGYAPQSYQQQGYQQQQYYPDTRSPQEQYSYTPQAGNADYYRGNGSGAGIQSHSQQQGPVTGSESDRGLLGAVGGGAAGAWGGHKAGHGVLGALGGAILGSLAEDYAKKHSKKNQHTSKPPKHQTNSSYGRSSSPRLSSASTAAYPNDFGSVASSFFHHKK
ncbi:hypothetical protein A1O3_02775 [Capronia epimyces CBS 606.96]|uniref:Glycine zipper 2TM domain-containing protein n=1 Tax=Capronia epimyces CBS 606.96 TaxID=1182542 RepID=W9YB04_9EURO|nr:uncharacterized protein A1O3_02775 [Capronia epimyces CBS 606.96]EXJ89708.1 hypothetical protein A1O3_02775 [Capronia epimyces CBS 606.96]